MFGYHDQTWSTSCYIVCQTAYCYFLFIGCIINFWTSLPAAIYLLSPGSKCTLNNDSFAHLVYSFVVSKSLKVMKLTTFVSLKSGEEESNLPKESVPKSVKVFQEWQMSGVVRVTVINSGGILKIRLICIKLRLL